ncbi:MAG TPA: ATP-binding protein [Treponemataceae bacterium]|jgi:two-component system phosphate regulon sensor histidine kinase PhoR|nr:ATP-binding protein [Treponemataceae bacterium]
MKKRIFFSICLTSIAAVLLTLSIVTVVLYRNFVEEIKKEIMSASVYIVLALDNSTEDILALASYKAKHRITLIDADGTVLFDNFSDIRKMDNHLMRPEVQSALQNGSGESTRTSDTLLEQTYYHAALLKDGRIIRLANTTRSFFGIIENALFMLFFILFIVAAIAISVAHLLTKMIMTPIYNVNLESPLDNSAYDEFSPLFIKIDRQNKEIKEKITQLEAKKNELSCITENMSEGLIILGKDKTVLSANKSAKLLFNLDHLDLHKEHYLSVCRDPVFSKTAEEALSGKSSTGKLEKDGRIFQILASPVLSGHSSIGAVLFIVDNTDKERAEKMRREFSANVSHELKTPLTSIIGYAEIMQNGIAKQEDSSKFISLIYSEGQRLLSLIEDIIKISRLEENSAKDKQELLESVDICSICSSVVKELEHKAREFNVSFKTCLPETPVIIQGIPLTLHEMIFNVCDNAVTYNKEGGSVTIEVLQNFERENIEIIISDTGIGIAPEHQSRIFERFYRVDKSHSKKTGGTGLGLAIVKHGAQLMNSKVFLSSELGKGTMVSFIFRS